jgi:hypothetical protein
VALSATPPVLWGDVAAGSPAVTGCVRGGGVGVDVAGGRGGAAGLRVGCGLGGDTSMFGRGRGSVIETSGSGTVSCVSCCAGSAAHRSAARSPERSVQATDPEMERIEVDARSRPRRRPD